MLRFEDGIKFHGGEDKVKQFLISQWYEIHVCMYVWNIDKKVFFYKRGDIKEGEIRILIQYSYHYKITEYFCSFPNIPLT